MKNESGSIPPFPGMHFTLIELMIVIAVIAILAGMLLPTLQNTLNKARSTGCQNNQRTISQANCLYSIDYNGFLPGNNNTAQTRAFPLPAGAPSNAFNADTHDGLCTISPFAYAMWIYLQLKPKYWQKAGWSFQQNNPLKCPADRFRQQVWGECGHHYSYGTNLYIDSSQPGNHDEMKRPEKISRPSRYAFLMETLCENNPQNLNAFGLNTYPMKPGSVPSKSTAGVDFRHNNSINAMFLDSHVQNLQVRELFGSDRLYILPNLGENP